MVSKDAQLTKMIASNSKTDMINLRIYVNLAVAGNSTFLFL